MFEDTPSDCTNLAVCYNEKLYKKKSNLIYSIPILIDQFQILTILV